MFKFLNYVKLFDENRHVYARLPSLNRFVC